MAKTQEELVQLKAECETLNHKLGELTEDELKIVIGGEVSINANCPYACKINYYECNLPFKGSKIECTTSCKMAAESRLTPGEREQKDIDSRLVPTECE